MGNIFSKKSRFSMMNRVSSMLFAVAAVFFCSASAIAETFEEGGLYYTVIHGEKNNVEVSRSPADYGYVGDIVIPATVTHEGTEYNVVSMENSFCFSNSYLTSVSIPGSVTRIPENAFSGCTMLRSVIIGEGITEIGYNAFYYCDILTSLKLPSSLLCIKKEAFRVCEKLAYIEFPENLERIGLDAFYGTAWDESQPAGEVYVGKVFYKYKGSAKFTDFDIKEGTVGIGGGALYEKKELQSVTIPASVRNIEDGAFEQCRNLADVKFGAVDSIEYVGSGAFASTKWEESFTEDGIYIGKSLYMYKDSTKVDYAVVREGTEVISPGAFIYNTTLKSVTFPASVKFMGHGNFKECYVLESVTFAEGSKLKELEHDCFSGCPSLKKLELPEGLELIGSNCISETGAVSISLPSTLRGIGHEVFYENMSLQEIAVPEHGRRFCAIDGVLFTADKKKLIACPAMKIDDYVIPDGVEIIQDYSFMGSGLSSVTIPASVKNIKREAFSETPNLKKVEIRTPSNLKFIGDNAFYSSGLQSIIIPEGCEIIGVDAFGDCMNLSDITFPKTLKEYQIYDLEGFFYEGSPWYEAQPDGVVYTGNLAYRIKGQTPSEIVFKEGTTAINSFFCSGNNDVTSVTLPASLKHIGFAAFEGATKLATVTNLSDSIYANCSFINTPWFISHPDGFVNLGKNVVGVKTDGGSVAHLEVDEGIENISLCNLGALLGIEKITLPKSTKIMTMGSFNGYEDLKELNIKATVPPVFDGSPSDIRHIYSRCVLKVPAGSLDAYKNALFWNLFRNIEEDQSGIEAVGTAESNVRVFADGDNIVVEGAEEGTPVEVFNLNGQSVYRGVETLISVPARGIYLVRIEGKTYKVVR